MHWPRADPVRGHRSWRALDGGKIGPMPTRVLFLAAEVAPFAKTGGLADVAGALPKSLHAAGYDVRVVMPAYQSIEHAYHYGNPQNLLALPGQLRVPVESRLVPTGVYQGLLPGSQVPVYFIAEWNLFGRPRIYGYGDDAYRFAFFSRAAYELAMALDWRPEIVHAHDWHAAPAIAWLATAGQGFAHFHNVPSLFTIHNLAHQGQSDWKIFNYLGMQSFSLAQEAHGEVNFMARGIHHATLINTVSPTYAREITTAEMGAGLDGLLRSRSFDLHGILNGIDYSVWSPEEDTALVQNYDIDTLDEKVLNKRDLQARLGLPVRDDVPLVAMVTRLDWQKGLDITGHVIHLLLNNVAGEAQFVILGTGTPQYEQMLARLAAYHRQKMAALLQYDALEAQRIYAASDIFLMPSLFEPCGLGQLIALRYGSVPVVRATGGLEDTIEDGITGFKFYEYEAGACWGALRRALDIFNNDRSQWRAIQQNGMRADFSWERSAEGYRQLYEWAGARNRGW